MVIKFGVCRSYSNS